MRTKRKAIYCQTCASHLCSIPRDASMNHPIEKKDIQLNHDNAKYTHYDITCLNCGEILRSFFGTRTR